MNCKYSYYYGEMDSFNMQSLYCNISKEKCYACRRCMNVNRIISIDGYKDCKLYINKEESMIINKETPNKVLFEKRGKLYIETNDKIGQVVVLDNPFDNVPKAVCLILIDEVYYIKGYEPKKVYTKKEIPQNEKRS